MMAHRYGRPVPARWCFGETQNRAEVMHQTHRTLRRCHPACEFLGCEFGGNAFQFTLRHLALIDQLGASAAREGVTTAQLSLAWVLSRGENIVTIPGSSNEAHVAENIARWDWDIPAAVATEVDALINQSTVRGHRYGEAMRASIDTEDYV